MKAIILLLSLAISSSVLAQSELDLTPFTQGSLIPYPHEKLELIPFYRKCENVCSITCLSYNVVERFDTLNIKPVLIRKYEYDKTGNLTSYSQKWSSGLETKETFTYDSKHNLLEKNTYSNGILHHQLKLDEKVLVKYDSLGNRTQISEYTASGELNQRIIFSYVPELDRALIYDGSGELDEEEFTYDLYPNGRIMAINSKYNQTVYDTTGQLIRVNSLIDKQFNMELTKNQFGDFVKIKDWRLDYKFDYKFDKKGNATDCIRYMIKFGNWAPIEYTKCKIVYCADTRKVLPKK